MNLEALPRTLYFLRASESDKYPDLNAKAAEATAAFVRDVGVCESASDKSACEGAGAGAGAGDAVAGAPLLVLLDQRALPYEERYACIRDYREAIDAISNLVVRGAPAIGLAGAAGLVLAAAEFADKLTEEKLHDVACEIIGARPTAVNLKWAVDRVASLAGECLREKKASADVIDCLFLEVQTMIAEDESANRELGRLGAALLPKDATVLTHCNAGSLATSFFGTALGVIYAAADLEAGGLGIKRVYSDETRPVGQGARLTVWELSRAGIPVTLICDDMAASVLSTGEIDAVIVGADRVAANGDVANKIGTLSLAIAAKEYGVPFYVACPTSTIDAACVCGTDIRIEERPAEEVLPRPIAGVAVFNPAFDITPASLITAIITEAGVFAPRDILRALD